MNRIYKVIYSKARQCYIVVSELAKSNHKSSQQGADRTNTPALARIIAVALAAGALTWGTVPGVSWAADTTQGSGDGVAIGTGSNAPKAENVAIGKGATISYSNGASSATGDIVVGYGANINNYASQGGSIALGKNAKVENMAGGGEASFAFGQTTFSGGWWSSSRIPADPSKVVGSIAIGDNTFARTGSTMIGSHNYKGELGDTTVDSASTRTDALNVYATTIGANSFSNGAFTTSTGAYNIISGDYNGGRSANPVKNMGATITGALNSIESKKEANYYSGIASSIVGVANRTSNSNGSLIFGAGNEIKNSITDISAPTSGGDSAKAFQDSLMKAVQKSKSGGATLVIGGGNKADYTQKTQILGVNNTVTGTEKNISDYNMIDGFGNTITGASHLYTIGTNNKITNTKNTILAGDDYTNVSGLTDSVIIGNNRVSGKDDNAAFAYFSNQKNIVSIGNKNVLDSTDGSISIGNNNFMWRSGGQPEKYGYDTGNVAIGNNTYINSYLNQGDSIVIGKNATAMNMGGSLEKAFAFGTPEGKDYSGSIAIGQNSYARSGSTMIGIHNYQGKLGDLDIDFTKGKNEGSSGIANYQESIDATTIGNNSYNNGVFSTVVGSYTAVSGLYHNQKWGEKPYGVQNFGAAVVGSLNSVEGLTSTEHNTAGMADSILGSANRTKNANGTIMVGAGNVVEDSIKDFDASEIKTKNGIISPNALSDAMRTSIKNANGGGAAAIVGNGNEVKKSTNVSVMGSKNSVTSTTNSQIFGDNRVVTGADGAPIDGAVIIGSAAAESPLTTDKKNVTILGYNANATVEYGVALGAGSVASIDNKQPGYDVLTKAASNLDDKTWKPSWAAVSVGDDEHTRQITNLAAGFNDTDAVNVAQLKNVMNMPVHIYSGGTINTTGTSITNNMTISNLQLDFGDGLKAQEVGNDGDKRVLVTLDKDALKNDPAFKGPKGDTGAQGPKGDKGDTGAQGPKGDKGDAGVQGPKGDKGDTGVQGPKGDKGDAGVQGPKGDKGDAGAQGPKGDKGDAGAQGPKGDKGDTGAQGPKGDKGDAGVQGSKGDKGDTGAQGPKGDKGDTGAQGPKGDKGDTGVQGPKGDKGDAGVQGPKGDKGDTGAQGPKGDKGDTGAQGPKGDKGDTGAQGPAGKDGKDGKDGGVGTVTDDGSNITVINTETDSTKPANYQVSLKKDINIDSVTADKVTAKEMTTDRLTINKDVSIEKGSKSAVNAGTVYNETRVKQDGKYVKASNTAGENLSVLDNQVASNSSNITNLNGRVNNLDSKVNKVGAGAAALAALHPLDFDPEDKWDFAVGYGNYRDANSVAVGAFYRPDDDTMFSVGTNFGNGENMINAGVSFKFGPKGKSQVRPGSTQEITELRATVARQDDQLKKQDNEIKELKAMVQQLMAKQDKQAATK